MKHGSRLSAKHLVNSEPGAGVDAMRSEWNCLSRENAFHYIKSTKDHWVESEFLESGERDVAELVDPFLAQVHFDPNGKILMEVGCGVGRMTMAFSRRFGEVEAVDISSEMVNQAKELQQKLGVRNVRFRVNSGQDLKQYDSESVDFCFSYIVFQHIPDVSIIVNYIREMVRILRRGGFLLFQVNGFRWIKFPGDYYLYWGICETGRLKNWNIHSRPCMRFGRLHGWKGVPVSVGAVKRIFQSSGMELLHVAGVGSQYMWLGARKG